MKTKEGIKNQVAKNHGYDNWDGVILAFKMNGGNLYSGLLSELMDEAMELYAEEYFKEKGSVKARIQQSHNAAYDQEANDIDRFCESSEGIVIKPE